jgi:zinc transporter ZupT
LILTMDWVAEGFTLVLLGVLVAVVTMRGGSADPVTQAVYAVAAGALLVFAVWTAATAARGSVVFKLCPVVKSLAAVLLLAAIAL